MAQASLRVVSPFPGAVDARAGQDKLRCRLCSCTLGDEADDDTANRLCNSCLERPEGKRLKAAGIPDVSNGARDFTRAELALVSKVHRWMPAAQLLELLNERLTADLGPDAARYTADQLKAAIEAMPASGSASAATPGDWASLRRLLADAARRGILKQINEQVIDDFAIVFGLNAKQVLVLKDTLLRVQDEEKDDA